MLQNVCRKSLIVNVRGEYSKLKQGFRYNITLKCDAIRKSIDAVRKAQEKGWFDLGGFIIRNLTRNGPMRLIINMPILSIFHHCIYNTNIMNKENTDHPILQRLLKIIQYRLFRGGFPYKIEVPNEKTIEILQTVANVNTNELKHNLNAEETAITATKNLLNTADSEHEIIVEKNTEDSVNSKDIQIPQSETLSEQQSRSETTGPIDKLLERAKAIFEKEKTEIIKYLGKYFGNKFDKSKFDETYCLSEEEHYFLLKQYEKYWTQVGYKVKNIATESVTGISLVTANIGSAFIALGVINMNTIAGAPTGVKLLGCGLALVLIAGVFYTASHSVIVAVESGVHVVNNVVNGIKNQVKELLKEDPVSDPPSDDNVSDPVSVPVSDPPLDDHVSNTLPVDPVSYHPSDDPEYDSLSDIDNLTWRKVPDKFSQNEMDANDTKVWKEVLDKNRHI